MRRTTWRWVRGLAKQARASHQTERRRPRLEALEERLVLSDMTFTVINTGDAGQGIGQQGDLRFCLTAANNNSGGVNTINFNIAPSGVQTINILSPLPIVSGTVILNATTEPSYAGTPLVVLNGSHESGGSDGLVINAGPTAGCFVRGLCIQGFQFNGLTLEGTGHTSVEGCFLGTDATGTVAVPNGASGLADFENDATIGGTQNIDRNLLSGNLASGLVLDGAGGSAGSADHNLVENNYIGTDVTGTKPLPNQADGVFLLNHAEQNTIGNVGINGRNVISGNAGRGVEIDSPFNRVQNNYIGTDASGGMAVGNAFEGVGVFSNGNTIGGTGSGAQGNLISGNLGEGVNVGGSKNVIQANLTGTNAAGTSGLGNGISGVAVFNVSNNTIGGTAAGQANTIAFNAHDGVQLSQGHGNAVLQDAIFGNGNLGIELQKGANHRQAAPKLTSAITSGSSITIAGTLTSAALATFTLDFFANPVDGPKHHAQGQTFLGAATVTTDSTGTVSFSETFSVAVPAGQFITATATDAANDTSAFSLSVKAKAPTGPAVLKALPLGNDPGPGQQTGNVPAIERTSGAVRPEPGPGGARSTAALPAGKKPGPKSVQVTSPDLETGLNPREGLLQ